MYVIYLPSGAYEYYLGSDNKVKVVSCVHDHMAFGPACEREKCHEEMEKEIENDILVFG